MQHCRGRLSNALWIGGLPLQFWRLHSTLTPEPEATTMAALFATRRQALLAIGSGNYA